ncbi:hypothetical protein EJ02DRAFT_457904 [Clathrospora elynae]|uniref:Uncharacterized protein n=1 Tax=Clathrospora elynae TaxID=706981 RepID=A0A6A5SEC0_9PLEO|nr:hypothetical protein EJ02DRAFT_457904 [Clathrospora elynae]
MHLEYCARSVDQDEAEVTQCYYVVFKLFIFCARMRYIVFFVAIPVLIVVLLRTFLSVFLPRSTPKQGLWNPLSIEEAH